MNGPMSPKLTAEVVGVPEEWINVNSPLPPPPSSFTTKSKYFETGDMDDDLMPNSPIPPPLSPRYLASATPTLTAESNFVTPDASQVDLRSNKVDSEEQLELLDQALTSPLPRPLQIPSVASTMTQQNELPVVTASVALDDRNTDDVHTVESATIDDQASSNMSVPTSPMTPKKVIADVIDPSDVVSTLFDVRVMFEDGSEVTLKPSLFTNAQQLISFLSKNYGDRFADMDEGTLGRDGTREDLYGLWMIKLDGGMSRFTLPGETPFLPGDSTVRYLVKLKRVADDVSSLNGSSMYQSNADLSINDHVSNETLTAEEKLGVLVKIQIDGCIRGIVLFKRLAEIMMGDIKAALAISVKVSADAQWAFKSHNGTKFENIDPTKTYKEWLEAKTNQTALCLFKRHHEVTLEEFEQLVFERNRDADNATVKQFKSQLAQMYTDVISTPVANPRVSILSQDSSAGDKQVASAEKKRLTKLTTILGVKSEKELAHLIEASSLSGSPKDKRKHKLAKVLGLHDSAPSLATNTTEKKPIWRSVARLDERSQSGASLNQPKMRPTSLVAVDQTPSVQVTENKFIVRIYLMNQTYKSLNLPLDIDVGQVLKILIEKLNIKDAHDSYALWQVYRGTERRIDPSEKLFVLVKAWEDNEILVFRKSVSPKRESSILPHDTISSNRIATINSLTDMKTLASDKPEIQEIMSMIKSSGKDISEEPIRESLIVKDGWLMVAADGRPGVRDNVWCFIENNTFNVTRRDKSDNTAPTVYHLSECIITQSMSNPASFEITLANGNVLRFFTFSPQLCEEWIKTLDAAKEKKLANKVATLHTVKVGGSVGIDDFEIHRVLGRGQYGKVLLCRHKTTGNVYAIKVIKKSSIKNEQQVKNTQNESRILRAIRHPFIVGLYYAFQTNSHLHLVMEYVNGGELFFHISHFGRFSEERVRFYAAEILLALQCLHGKGIIYRDLKLENILLDKDGHVKITDFGLSKEEHLQDEGNVVAGTFEYLAPEVLGGESHSVASDWWAFGIVIFEMSCGFHPFYTQDREELLKRVIEYRYGIPKFVSETTRDLIKKLLCKKSKRLGGGADGSAEIQRHPFFLGYDFDKLFKKAIEPPFVPDVADDLDVSFFDNDFTSQPISMSYESTSTFIREHPDAFAGFTYNPESQYLNRRSKLSFDLLS